MRAEQLAKGDLHHLDHFVVAVMSPDRAEKFYREVLGARTLKRHDSPNMARIFMKLERTTWDFFHRGKRFCRSVSALRLIRDILFWFPKVNSNQRRRRFIRRARLSETFKVRVDSAVAGRKDWSFRIQREISSKSQKAMGSARRSFTIFISTARI